MKLRITEKRKRILETLQKHDNALSAKDIHRHLPTIDLVTIYRNLDLFVKEKLVKKVHFDTGEILYEYQKSPHHHAICEECEHVIHFTAPDEKIKKLLGVQDFQVNEIEVTVRGFCKKKSRP